MSEQVNKPATLAKMLGVDTEAEQMKKVDTLIGAAYTPDIVVTVHYKPSTKRVYFATTGTLTYDQLINLLSEGMKAASAMKAEDAQKAAQESGVAL
jgi:hypothetical protein